MFPASVRHILVPIDFSEPSDRALEVAAALARPAQARLTLVHALEPAVAFVDAGVGVSDVLGVLVNDAQIRLAERAARTRLSCDTVLRIGSPVDEIVACLEQRGPDLVVMSTHGRTGLPHAMLGSVAERVLQRSPCPVLVLPRHLA